MNPRGLLAAYVLHTRRYGDTSLLVELLTREQGRTAGIAKGILRSSGRGLERPQPFRPLLIDLRGRGEVRTLTMTEQSARGVSLTGKKLYCGLYLNELITKLTAREDPCMGLFDDYANAIAALEAKLDPEPVLRGFELRLLEHLGHGLLLDQDAEGRPIDPVKRYTYVIGSGAFPALGDTQSISGRTMIALRSENLDNLTAGHETLREARYLMRTMLNHYLDGRPLRSRELFR